MYSNQTLSGTEITTDPINLCIFNNEGGMVHTSFLLHITHSYTCKMKGKNKMITIESNKNFEVKSIMVVKIDGKDCQFIVTQKEDGTWLESNNHQTLSCEDLKKICYEMYCKAIAPHQRGINVCIAGGKTIHIKEIMTIADDIKEAMGGDFTDLVTVSIN